MKYTTPHMQNEEFSGLDTSNYIDLWLVDNTKRSSEMKKIGFILLLFIGFNLILVSPMIFLAIFSAIYEHKEANSGEKSRRILKSGFWYAGKRV